MSSCFWRLTDSPREASFDIQKHNPGTEGFWCLCMLSLHECLHTKAIALLVIMGSLSRNKLSKAQAEAIMPKMKIYKLHGLQKYSIPVDISMYLKMSVLHLKMRTGGGGRSTSG